MKKGQAEILGLALLVIILTIILVLALRFSFNFSGNKDDVRTGLIANSLLNSIVKQDNIREMIHSCYIEFKKGTKNGCPDLEKELNKIISLSVNKKFQVILSADPTEFFKKGECAKGIQSTPYRFKEQGETLTATLKLC